MNIVKKKLQCTVCNYDARYYNKLKEFTLYYCDNCQHFFTDIESIQNKETYSQDYFKEKHSKWFENPNFQLFDYIFDRIQSTGLSYPSVLDAGCGNGNLLRYLHRKSNNIKLTGIDYKNNSSEEGINFLCGDIFDTELTEKYDVIISLAVIEHIWDVQAYIKRLSELCKGGGLIINMTLNNSSLLYGFARAIYHLGMKAPMERLYDKHHLNHFSKHSLEYLYKKSSLDIVENHISQFNIKSLSLPKSNPLMSIIYKLGLVALFISERLLDKKHMQTITAHKTD
ncbi:MAG: class I SAM-dependent methyltransferase [Planctomycetota bacterium]|jgi:2-polyprenyl-3-methyl-5-hydroxy-6-metoxy-1,4-benzoquinol methylase